MAKIGLVRVNKAFLVRILGYRGGDIKSIRELNQDGYEMVEFLIEHPAFEEVPEGNIIATSDTILVRNY